MKKILVLLVLALSFSGCEKDDICTEETTPRLVLEFYDVSNPANLKNVVSLKIKGEGAFNDLDLGTFNGVSKVELPLNPNAVTTKYSLILNSSGTSPNQDNLEFNYTTQNVFVSRACGYKTIYELNTANGLVLTEPDTPDSPWILSYTLQTNTITTENETHLKIYF
ncbi:DUF6452 family protein [Flavobacterium sp. XGLA_31]|uniref:DUF6452 family protein n=1 Tax=Flavobacterium sp. XGLA_31 TaxID=3447666 RepID=UPI003F39EECB